MKVREIMGNRKDEESPSLPHKITLPNIPASIRVTNIQDVNQTLQHGLDFIFKSFRMWFIYCDGGSVSSPLLHNKEP